MSPVDMMNQAVESEALLGEGSSMLSTECGAGGRYAMRHGCGSCKVLVSLIYIETQTDYDDYTSSEQMQHFYISSENYLIMMNDLVQPEE